MTPEPPTKISTEQELAETLTRAENAAKAGRLNEGAGICLDVLDRIPEQPHALALLGTIYSKQEKLDEGIAILERAVALGPPNPVWQGNLCELYRLVHRLEDALSAGQEALRLSPGRAGTHVMLAKVQVDRGDADQALTHFLAALSIDPDDPNAHLGIGQILLSRGEFRPGWIEYEWRNKLDQAKGMLPEMKAPVWNGMAHPNGRIVLVGDQGYGDTLQFVRYVPIVAARCGEVVLGCATDLEPLLKNVTGVGRCFARWQDCPGFTSYALLSSLPGILGTDLSNIPCDVPYLFADPDKVRAWKERLDAAIGTDDLRIGIFWAGRPTHPNDRRRSLRLSHLLPFGEIDGVRLVSLQKDVPPQDAADLGGERGPLDLSKELTDFSETAAVLENLDLLVTVDSAVGHLAGALGKPVWVLMPRPADWRWLLDRSDTPWYPTLRLFRQGTPGAWEPVLSQVREELRALAAARRSSAEIEPTTDPRSQWHAAMADSRFTLA